MFRGLVTQPYCYFSLPGHYYYYCSCPGVRGDLILRGVVTVYYLVWCGDFILPGVVTKCYVVITY